MLSTVEARFDDETPLTTFIPLHGDSSVAHFHVTDVTFQSGLRGSVWSSLFQAMVLFAGAGAITLRSSLMASASGNGSESADSVVGAILTSAPHVFNLDPSPFSKTASTTWALGAGQVVQWAWLFGCSQTAVQRYSAARTLAHARG